MSLNSTEKKSVRRFGLIAFGFFGGLCGLALWTKKPSPAIVFGCLCLLGIGFTMLPGPFAHVYEIWHKAAHIIGKVVTSVILTISYYVVITPAGLLKRVFGGRPLPIRPDRTAATYWRDKNESAQPIERFTKRY